MPKTNFTKAEEALSDAVQKMNREKLLELADKAAGKPALVPPDSPVAEKLQFVRSLERNVKYLRRLDRDLFKKLGIKKKAYEELIKKADNLLEEEWQKIVQIKDSLDKISKEITAATHSNDELVEKERHKHINKRFNVNDKWLPLK